MMKKSRTEYSQKLHLEKSKSSTGKHAFVSKAFVLDKSNGSIVKIIEPQATHSPSVYSRGVAEEKEVKYDTNEVLVLITFVQTPQKKLKRKVKGEITVFDEGKMVYRAVYRELKLRGSYGDPKYFKYVETVLRSLNVPIKRSNPDAHLPRTRS